MRNKAPNAAISLILALLTVASIYVSIVYLYWPWFTGQTAKPEIVRIVHDLVRPEGLKEVK